MPSRRPTVGRGASADPESSTVILPPVDADPISYLGPSSTAVDFLGREWIVPPLSAADWLEVIWAQPFVVDDIFPGFVNDLDLEDAISDVLFSDGFDPESLGEVAMEMLEMASGYRWWFTLKLCTSVRVSWARLGGMLVLSGVDPRAVTLGSWVSAVLALLGEHVRPKEFASLLMELNTPPAGHELNEQDQMEMDEAEFMAAMNSPY